jgi:twinkle protein
VGELLRHEPCPSCGSKDNLARYKDGSAWCFTENCRHYERGDGKIETREEAPSKPFEPMVGEFRDLGKREITRETCEKWGYQVGENDDGAVCHIANYRGEGGKLVAQKIRLPGKKFKVLGNGKGLPLYGQWLWGKGKHIVITEGEIDALSVSQAQDNKWPVVSLPNGAQSAERSITQAYEYLDQFENITLMFDMDEPGQSAAEVAAGLLPVGKVRIAALPEKDPNEVLVKHGAAELVRAFWNAKPWRPDGIRHARDLEAEFFSPNPNIGIPYPWERWNDVLGGMRQGELVTLTAGSGVGKSTLIRELIHHALVGHNQSVGALMLEEANRRTMEGIVAVHLSKNIALDRALASATEVRDAFNDVSGRNLYLYDHFGSTEVDNVSQRIRYLVRACGVQWVFLDHLSILVSGLETADERRTIDIAMTKLRTLVSELQCGLFCVVHLRRPQGDKGHEDGAEVHLGQLRGSHAIAQLSDAVIGLQKSEDDPHGPNIEAVCLKNRWSGEKGSLGSLTYDRMSGRLSDCAF